MALQSDFKEIPLKGISLNNPTSLQIGPDGRLYVSQQDGTIKTAQIQVVTDAQGDITEYNATNVETINLIKNIPNHNDDGALNVSVKNRQVTGLIVEEGSEPGEVVLYVSSSDPRIGAGPNKGDLGLDTNSGIISRLVLSSPTAPLGDSRWTKTDIVIGLPRSEENHSTNGMDIRTEMVNGKPHQIMYVASGGFTNKGAPSNNFAFSPEYYYAAAILRVDLTHLEKIEADRGLRGGTAYVNKYVYALPTLDDPTRPNDNNGHDMAVGITGSADAEAGSTFGGNNGLNQAKYDPDGPVQIYSMGYRNAYDVVTTKAGNIYTFDNGPNNGWGDVPLTADGNPVTSGSQIGTNNPNIDVDTGNDFAPDNLHLVTKGFYAGHPNPIYASGSAAGLYAVDISNGTPVVTQLTGSALPADWNTIAGINNIGTDPNTDVYIGPGSNPTGSQKGPDGSLLTIGSSSNGLTEYTAGGLSSNPNAEVLAVASFNGNITFMEIQSDGTQAGTNVTGTSTVKLSGTPLDLWAVGNEGINGQGLLAGSVFVAQFGANAVVVLTPGTPLLPITDQDKDGINDNLDPLQNDPLNGTGTTLNNGATLFWDFNPAGAGTFPGPSGEFNIGMTGWMINGTTELDGLRNLDNTIRGGAPGIIQIKSVGSGDFLGQSNNQQDAIQTGFLPASNVKQFTIKVPVFNPFSSDANNGVEWSNGASMGITLGDGSMANVLQIAIGAKNAVGQPVTPRIRVTYEENDTLLSDFEVSAPQLLNSVDDDQVELFLTVDMETLKVTPTWRYQISGVWSEPQAVGSNPVQLTSNGNIAKALKGQYFINGVKSAAVVSLAATSKGSEEFTADFLDLTISAVDEDSSSGGESGNPLGLYRINVGGGQVIAADGSVWSADTGVSPSPYRVGPGGETIYTTTEAINLNNTSLPSSALVPGIFQTERYDLVAGENMKWAFPVDDGDYEVRLYLAEIYNPLDKVGKRIFDVAVEGSVPPVFDDIDQFSLAGADTGLMLSYVATVADGSLNLEFLAEVQNPSLKGIEILSVGTAPVLPNLSIADVTVNEGSSTASFEVSLSAASSSTVTVEYATKAGTAAEGSDYIGKMGTLSFAPGETTKTITVDIIDDTVVEDTETFTVELKNPVGATLANANATGTIIDNDQDSTPPSPALIEPFQDIAPVDSVVSGQVGSAKITITPNSGIQTSSYGLNSFTVTNTGDKRVAAVYLDITKALFPDTVFDPQGLAGDSVSRGLAFKDTGNTGVYVPPSNKNDPNVVEPFYGEGGASGFEGMRLIFNPAVSGGFNPGELVKFGVDLDANSILGLPQKPIDINGNDPRLNTWDIGGVSGAELMNAKFHVLFTDGTTALGELLGDGSQGGAVAIASQNTPNKQVSLTINGLNPGQSGTYNPENIQVLISGTAGDTARVVLAKGFIQPFAYTAPDGTQIDLATKFANSPFPANNALQFQTKDVVLTGTVQNITSLFNFGAPGGSLSFPGDDKLPIGFVASIIDSSKSPLGPVSEPIYLKHDEAGNDGTINNPPVAQDDLFATAENVVLSGNVFANNGQGSDSDPDGDTLAVAAVNGAANAVGSSIALVSGALLTLNSNGTFTYNPNGKFDALADGETMTDSFTYTLTDGKGGSDTATATVTVNGVSDSSNNPPPSSGLYRINVGGAQVTAPDGSVWSADTGVSPSPYRVGTGGETIYTTTEAINLNNTSLPSSALVPGIFQTERYDLVAGENMKWAFPVDDGDYEVRLYLAEIYKPIDQVGKRVFDVAVEGNVPSAFDNIDPFSIAGALTGIMLSYGATVADGSLDLEFLAGVQNPSLKGIEILSVGTSSTVSDPFLSADNQLNTIRYEAEDGMNIFNYRPETITGASGNQVLSLLGGSTNEVGEVSFGFNETPGDYDIIIGTFDENDGIAQFTLELNGDEIGEKIILDQSLGSDLANSQTFVRRLGASNVSFEVGDILTVNGFENLREHARLDYVELVPSNVI